MSTEAKAAPEPRGLLRRLWRQLLEEHAEPRSLGLGVALGVVIGCSPLLGLQTILAIALASLFRLNRLSVLLGAQISVPPITALVFFLDAQCGELLLRGRLLPLTLHDIRAQPAKQLVQALLVDLTVGGLAVGLTIGAALGFATASAVRRRRARAAAPQLDPALLEALAARAKPLPRRWRSYARWKLRLDPAYAEILGELGGAASLLDLGSGMGLLAVCCTLRSPGVRVRGVDWDAVKLVQARALSAGLPQVTFEEGDLFAAELGAPDAIVLMDALHYAPVEAQRSLLQRCVEALPPGGKLLIRELASQRSMAVRLERWAVRLGLNRGAGVVPWGTGQMAEALVGLGLTVAARPCGNGVFSANVLLVAHKPRR